MDAGPRTLDNYQQQTLLVSPAKLHLFRNDEGITNRAGPTVEYFAQFTNISSSETSSSDSNSSMEESHSYDSSSSENSSNSGRHSRTIEIRAEYNGEL